MKTKTFPNKKGKKKQEFDFYQFLRHTYADIMAVGLENNEKNRNSAYGF